MWSLLEVLRVHLKYAHLAAASKENITGQDAKDKNIRCSFLICLKLYLETSIII